VYRNILLASFLGLVALAIAAAGLAIWGADEARYQLRRVELASGVLHEQLDLKADSYEMLRRLSDGIAGTAPERRQRPRRGAGARCDPGQRRPHPRGIAREIAFTRRTEEEAGGAGAAGGDRARPALPARRVPPCPGARGAW
jgi:hypothetical protein